ncbi:DNA mismatch repair protein family [Artemisia annua]|uniref:DNA mismatch repair protein family n=1 Tax=Artemisia annua TaxID=35608 RepID=A0A2U1NGA5_ARTAN|nr:DNA mismatch repair protein family [Artemisia annua]
MRSGVVLFDLTRVVEKLVFNSLDAGATKVIVVIGVGTNYIKVTDDGNELVFDSKCKSFKFSEDEFGAKLWSFLSE